MEEGNRAKNTSSDIKTDDIFHNDNMESGCNIRADESQPPDVEKANNAVPDTRNEVKEDSIEHSVKQLDTGEDSLQTKNDQYCPPDEGDSFTLIISDTGIEIPESPSNDSNLPLPGAYHVPGTATDQRGSNQIVSAVSRIITGDIIDNAFVVNDDIISVTERDGQKTYSCLVFVTVTFIIIAILSTTLSPQATVQTITNETIKNDKLQNETTTTFDDLKKIIIGTNVTTKDNLMNTSSPQSKALFWIKDEMSYSILLERMTIESLIQRYVLVVFYYSLYGGNWTNQYNFLTEGLSECMWGDNNDHITYNDHITCDKNGTITRIHLEKNNLSGTIPSEIGYLNSMTHLNLAENDISGSMPSSFEKIHTLVELDLGLNNRLSGTIPTSLANISNLEMIRVVNPNLSGFDEFCPLLEGKNIKLIAYCSISQLLDREKCGQYTKFVCCEYMKEDTWQCCIYNPTMSEGKCSFYN